MCVLSSECPWERLLNLASKPRAAGEVYKNKSVPRLGLEHFLGTTPGEGRGEGGGGRQGEVWWKVWNVRGLEATRTAEG